MYQNSFRRSARAQTGFTLIEVMIVVAIIAILASIALPSYSDYVLRGKLVEATNTLSATRANMEQYYQDNRTYQTNGAILSPCDAANLTTLNGSLKNFTISCPTLTATTYKLVATGSGATAGFIFNVTDANVQTSTVSAAWGAGNYACWAVKRGTTC